jgi:hypothetical protein
MTEKMTETNSEMKSKENIFLPTYIGLGLKKNHVTVTKWNSEDLTYLKQKFTWVSDRKITGIDRLRPSNKSFRNSRNFYGVVE